ncbi:MAG: AAA family ATPase [Bacteroidales bacterium]|nr:AAA family ATPase [Bacteroidales bacterium]
MDYTKIAQDIKESTENIFLIYAFNGTGKTQLSVAYKNITKKGEEHTGVYYNAFSEDLFVWDNDEPHDNKDIKLTVVTSSINEYHSYMLETEKDEDSGELIYPIQRKLRVYQPRYTFRINRYYSDKDKTIIDEEKGIESFSFFSEEDKEQRYPIKISRGEERIFVWCFFLALFDVIAADSEFIFIDDPVSSLDDYNLFISAREILSLMKKCCSDNKKLIVSTHHMGLFSILQDWIRKSENDSIFRPQRKQETVTKSEEDIEYGKLVKETILKETIDENKCSVKFLEIKNGEPKMIGKSKGNYQYHLLIMKELKRAINEEEVNTYHMVLLRQILESLSSFLGAGHFSYAIDYLVENANEKADIINALSHEKIFMQKLAKLNLAEQKLLVDVVDRLETVFHFRI